jgi:hypothetical protein
VKHLKKPGIIALGALLGFAYYKFIGCQSGTCPITSNPWISTGYGALIGLVISINAKKDKQENVQESK